MMNGILIKVERRAPFAAHEEALPALEKLAAALSRVGRMRRLWSHLNHEYVGLDAAGLGRLLEAERFIRAGMPGAPTRAWPLFGAPNGSGKAGLLCVTVLSDGAGEPFAGVSLRVSLAEELFEGDAAGLVDMLPRLVEAVAADEVVLGPSAWVGDLGIGWATFVPRGELSRKPAGVVVVPASGGGFLIAHGEEP
jgi:hypothetical protein